MQHLMVLQMELVAYLNHNNIMRQNHNIWIMFQKFKIGTLTKNNHLLLEQ
jgi:hypothetical protein